MIHISFSCGFGYSGSKLNSKVLKNKHQAVSQGVRRFGKRSIVGPM
jgi:hypothetical protein